jgi:hypothetical protein
MELQEVFNKVYLGLAGQYFERSINGHGVCAYRGHSWRKCAIGHLIPDALYSCEMDSESWSVDHVLNSCGVRCSMESSYPHLTPPTGRA